MAGGARICLGQIGAAHGVRGEVRLRSFTAEPEAIAGYGPLETEDGRVVQIESAAPRQGSLRRKTCRHCRPQRGRAIDQRQALRAARTPAGARPARRVLSRRSHRSCGGRPRRRQTRHRGRAAQFRRRRFDRGAADGRPRYAAAAVRRGHRAGGRSRGGTACGRCAGQRINRHRPPRAATGGARRCGGRAC